MIYCYNKSVVEDVIALSESLSVIYSGVAMGQIFKGKLRPEHALALYVGMRNDAVPSVELELEDALNYLRRLDIPAALYSEGINRVRYRGIAIGFVKRIGARCNNMYPKEQRILNL
jgi:NOL1/NOP2/fmu family ribosome biogenesis protein